MNQSEIDSARRGGRPHLSNEKFKQLMGFEYIKKNQMSPIAAAFMKKLVRDQFPDYKDTVRCKCKLVDGKKCTDHHCHVRGDHRQCPKSCGKGCQNQPFRQPKLWKTKLRLVHRPKRKFSLVTTESIPEHAFVMEYIGEVFLEGENPDFGKSFYACDIKGKVNNQRLQIDPTHKGGWARFLAHSFYPNCKLESFLVQGKLRNVIIAIREILPGTELLFNYGDDVLGFGIDVCLCLEPYCDDFDEAFEETQKCVTKMIKAATTPQEAEVTEEETDDNSLLNVEQSPPESDEPALVDSFCVEIEENEMTGVPEHDEEPETEQEVIAEVEHVSEADESTVSYSVPLLQEKNEENEIEVVDSAEGAFSDHDEAPVSEEKSESAEVDLLPNPGEIPEETELESGPESGETEVSLVSEHDVVTTADEENQENLPPQQSSVTSNPSRKRKRSSPAKPAKSTKKSKSKFAGENTSAQVSTRSPVSPSASPAYDDDSATNPDTPPEAEKTRKRGRPRTRPLSPPGEKEKRKRGRPKLPESSKQCSICNKIFKKKDHLQAHTLLKHHTENDPIFQCPLCPSKFYSPDGLRVHNSRSHLPDEVRTWFYCQSCDIKFCSESFVKRHQNQKKSTCDKTLKPIRVEPGQKYKPRQLKNKKKY